MKKNSKKGFTLVELSIVLVIIGLLIGGILAAQSMIGTAKIQAMTRQIGQFDSAVANYQTKFNQLPGDDNLMGTAGDNNGTITDGTGAAPTTTVAAYTGEIGKFWFDLSQSGLSSTGGALYTDSSTNAAPTSGSMTSRLAPQASAGTNAYYVAFGSGGKNYYQVAQYTFGAAQALTAAAAFKPADMLAFDTKLDDGVANTGNVVAIDTAALIPDAANPTTTNTTSANCSIAAADPIYKVANNAVACEARIRIGTSNGLLN